MIRSNDVSETFELLVVPAPGGVHISLHPMRFRRCGEPESQVRQRGVIVACDNLSVTVRSEKMQRLAPVVEVPIDNNHPFVQSAPRTLQASVHEEVMRAGIVVWIKHVTAHIRPRVLSDKLNAQALMRSAGKPART